ncbi:hypothetical protein Celaphus_00002864 [Cervus elaphus hippelaphus]|uniref:Uncharacterized protein n=1 Tax=Cervus elaphus hippelaphus TaxID=46360 RepID=A0A212D139_CEREH|nr:hypothetical protein Celaphus_00002864 [Cervus elaphus hippelaphus]
MEAGVGAIANPFLKDINPLKCMPSSLGIPVEHLVESSRKCVAELGPEPTGALKVLLLPPILAKSTRHQLSSCE